MFQLNWLIEKQQRCEIFIEMRLKYRTKGAEHRNI
jgi:hypothetical protein